MRLRLLLLACLAGVLSLGGCRAPGGTGAAGEPGGAGGAVFVPPPIRDVPAPLPSWAEVVRRYNAAAAPGLDRFSARVGVELTHTDGDGVVQRESGAGKLLFRRPLDTALSVSVVGNTILWAGSNAERWWVFSELHRAGRLTDGPLDGVADPVAGGLPFRPDALPLVLGLRRLDPERAPPAPAVEGLNGFWLIEPPGVGARLLIDPRTGRAVRVDLLGPDGRTRVVTRLDGEVPVEGGPAGAALPVLIDAYPVEGGTRLSLTVRSARVDDPALRDRLFDLDALIDHHRPGVRD